MDRRQTTSVRRPRAGTWLPVLLVCAVFAAAVGAYLTDAGPRLLGTGGDPVSNPAAVAPPPGLDLPAVGEPPAVARPIQAADAGRADKTKVAAALAPYLAKKQAGVDFDAAVVDVSDGKYLLGDGSESFTPASTTKVVTAVAALEALGPATRFSTRVVRAGDRVTLVGGGDPYLATKPVPAKEQVETYPPRADVTTLARQSARALKEQGVGRVRVDYDDTLFTGPRSSPAWEASYLPEEVVPPITALWVDRGEDPSGSGFSDDPSRAAADAFVAALTDAGITVTGQPQRRKADSEADELASVQGPRVDQIVQRVLDVSDNEGAEILAHQVGLKVAGEGSFAGGARGVRDTLEKLGIDTGSMRLNDGSGLSRDNVLTTRTLLESLRTAASSQRPELRAAVTGLPVAGFTGSLADRYAVGADAGRGRVRAKTGTLTGVHGLAGVATDRDGDLMAFVFVANRVSDTGVLPVRTKLDQLSAALGACRCAA